MGGFPPPTTYRRPWHYNSTRVIRHLKGDYIENRSFFNAYPPGSSTFLQIRALHLSRKWGLSSDPGIIMYEVDGTKQMIPYSHMAVLPTSPRPHLSDKVEFLISECLKNNTKTAIMVQTVAPTSASPCRGGIGGGGCGNGNGNDVSTTFTPAGNDR